VKKCQFCAEEIQDTATKCKYCGERLDTVPSSQQWTFAKPHWVLFIIIAGIIVVAGIFFRYESEQVGNRLIRYDRFMSRVEWKSVFSKNGNWRPLKFKNLQQAKAVFQRRDLEDAAENASENNKNDSGNDDYQKRMKEIDDEYNRNMQEIKRQEMENKMHQQQDEIDRLKRESEY